MKISKEDMESTRMLVWKSVFFVMVLLCVLLAFYLSARWGMDTQNYSGDTRWVNIDRYVIEKYIGSNGNLYFMVSDKDNTAMDTVEVSKNAYNSYDVGDYYDTAKIQVTELIDPDKATIEITTTWIPRVAGALMGLVIFGLVLNRKVRE